MIDKNIFRKTEAILYDYNNLALKIDLLKAEIKDIEETYQGCGSISYEERTQATNKFNSSVENGIKFYIRTREIKGTTFSNRIKEKIYIKYSAALHKDTITSLMSKKYINDYEWARIILKEKGFISHKEK